MKTIYEFTKNDSIVRIQPAKSLGPIINLIGQSQERSGDRSYLGEELIFVGIANGQIYLKSTDEFRLSHFGDKLLSLDLDLWDEGWEYYIDPLTLTDDNYTISIDIKSLENRLDKALDNEDYELAEKIKLMITKENKDGK